MSILVTGGSGLVGKHLKDILPDAIYMSSGDCDLRDSKQVDKFWNDINFLSICLFPLCLVTIIFSILKTHFIKGFRSNIPAICVGNIFIGGTGKTPICIKLKDLIAHISRPVVIKKNYKNQNDEIELLKKYSKTFKIFKNF